MVITKLFISISKNVDSYGVFIQWLNAVCKSAQMYYRPTYNMLFPPVPANMLFSQ